MIERSESVLVRHLQKKHFARELQDLFEVGADKKNSPLCKLDPVVKDGVIKAGGRLDNAPVPNTAKHRIVPPIYSILSTLILKDIHSRN